MLASFSDQNRIHDAGTAGAEQGPPEEVYDGGCRRGRHLVRLLPSLALLDSQPVRRVQDTPT